MRQSFAGLLVLGLAGCGDGYGATSGTGGASNASGGASNASGGASNASGGASGATGSGGINGDDGGADVPATPDALAAFLRQRAYRSFAAEHAPHDSTGPHGGPVRVYYGPRAARSLQALATEFPLGAAAVKELGVEGESLVGWAVWVKIDADSRAGKGFYWYESVGDSTFEGVGRSGCVGCHAAGDDFLLSFEPFQ